MSNGGGGLTWRFELGEALSGGGAGLRGGGAGLCGEGME